MSVTHDLEEVLRTADVPTAIGAIYLAVKYITHPLTYPVPTVTAQKLPAVDLAPETETVLAARLIKVLEKHTGKPVASFSKETMREWIYKLTQLSFLFTEKQHPYNEIRGKELLAQLRAG